MSDISLALTDAIIAALKASASVQALLGNPARVYDDVPDNPTFPYLKVEIGAVHADLADCYEGYEIYPIINIWSRSVGSVEIKQITAAVFEVIRAGIVVTDNRLLSLTRYLDEFETDTDGFTKHAVLMLRAVAEA